jgi:hypothetical protein
MSPREVESVGLITEKVPNARRQVKLYNDWTKPHEATSGRRRLRSSEIRPSESRPSEVEMSTEWDDAFFFNCNNKKKHKQANAKEDSCG